MDKNWTEQAPDSPPAPRTFAKSRRALALEAEHSLIAATNRELDAEYADAPDEADVTELLRNHTRVQRGYDGASAQDRIRAAQEICKIKGLYAQPDLGDGLEQALKGLVGLGEDFKAHKAKTEGKTTNG